MCGIFGFVNLNQQNLEGAELEHDINKFLKLSEIRGKDSTGLVIEKENNLDLIKLPLTASKFMNTDKFKDFKKKNLSGNIQTQNFSYMGHCRLMTSGASFNDHNNQPIVSGDIIGVHNGIITSAPKDFNDSQYILKTIEMFYKQENSSESLCSYLTQKTTGSFTCAFYHQRLRQLIIITNVGSLYYIKNEHYFLYASEREILQKFLKSSALENIDNNIITQLKPHEQLAIDLESRKVVSSEEKMIYRDDNFYNVNYSIRSPDSLKRCSRCILPSTYPFIHFDTKGVCNFCLHYQKQKLHGEEALLRYLDKFRSKDGSPDTLVGLSGGRDSCYGIHLLKTKYGMNPVAYTFDWGLTTEISRKNQALMCGELGIEHIIRTPDIVKKRRFVRKNVMAWCKKPHLGMVPLFQAGDKEFYHYGRKLREELNIDLTVLCSGYQLEQREFMIGFAGVDQPPVRNNHDFYYHPMSTKLHLAYRYCLEYLKNPAYINESFYESVRAYFMSFFAKSDFLYLFHYLPWNESEIDSVLKNKYGWITDDGYGKNQWRMGDGQTAFNNYIYYKVAGFSEYDTFRSNQIREGLISRDEAIKLTKLDNIPKTESMNEFFKLIGLSEEEVMRRIESIPTLY